MIDSVIEKKKYYTNKTSKACHAIPPAVTKSTPEIPSAPSVSNLPCPAVSLQIVTINFTIQPIELC